MTSARWPDRSGHRLIPKLKEVIMTNNASDQPHLSIEAVYAAALRDVADGRRTPLEREAAARLVAFVLHEREMSEAVAADVLAAAQRSFDLATAVLTLMLGLRDTLADPKRFVACTTQLAHQALARGHREGFLVLVQVLVGLGDFSGDLPPSWVRAFVRAQNDRDLRERVSQTTDAYSRRFGRCFWTGTRQVRDGAARMGGAS